MAGAVAHQVGTADMRAHSVAGEAARRAEAGCPVEGLHIDDALGDDGLFGVDVAQECIQRPGPLRQAFGQLRPLGGSHHARHQVDGEQLGAALTGNAEGDVVGALLLLDICFSGSQLRHPEAGDGVQHRPIVLSWVTLGVDGFVITGVQVGTGAVGRFAAGLVTEQQGRVVAGGGHGGRSAAGCLGDQLIDHIGETAAAPQGPPLPSRGRARDQRFAGQFADGFPVTAVF